jgi:hypothetical protein
MRPAILISGPIGSVVRSIALRVLTWNRTLLRALLLRTEKQQKSEE